jgi:uncharacterized OsmC-like protein
MQNKSSAYVHLIKGNAQVSFDHGSIKVASRDKINGDIGCPMHLLVGALGACIALTLDAVARNKGIDIKDLTILIDHSSRGDGKTQFNVLLNLSPTLTDREQKILFQSARTCEVGKILKGDVLIDYGVLDDSPDKT